MDGSCRVYPWDGLVYVRVAVWSDAVADEEGKEERVVVKDIESSKDVRRLRFVGVGASFEVLGVVDCWCCAWITGLKFLEFSLFGVVVTCVGLFWWCCM